MTKIIISEAEEQDLASLSTIVPRAFHPTNAHFRKLFPDTPPIRAWWEKVFAAGKENPSFRVLTVVDEDGEGKRVVVGVLCLQRCSGEPDDNSAEDFWTAHGWTPDHDPDLFMATMAPMLEHRARLMRGRRHLVLQLFGVDHAYQGRGVGRMLLRRACDVADEGGDAVFVEANMRAAPFYVRCGFALREEVPLPGEDAYVEGILVREPGGGKVR